MHRPVGVFSLLIAGLVFLPRVAGAASAISVDAVSVSPANPGPNALCTLSVRLKNAGTKTATNFRFKVTIEGKEVATYGIETYAVNVPSGTSETIPLHNFWTGAAKASFPVEVSVLEGTWADVKREGNASTTTPSGPIEGLPVSASQTVTMSAR